MFIGRIQMDVNNRKNEAKSDHKQRDIAIEVSTEFLIFSSLYTIDLFIGNLKSGYCRCQ